MVDTRENRYKARHCRGANQAHGFSRYSESVFNLRADRYPAKIFSEDICDVAIVPVSPIVSHFLSQEAGAYSHTWLFHSNNRALIGKKIMVTRLAVPVGFLTQELSGSDRALSI